MRHKIFSGVAIKEHNYGEILEGCREECGESHAQEKERDAEEWQKRQDRKKQAAGDRYRFIRGEKKGRKSAWKKCEENFEKSGKKESKENFHEKKVAVIEKDQSQQLAISGIL